jgi:hypothetical protein
MTKKKKKVILNGIYVIHKSGVLKLDIYSYLAWLSRTRYRNPPNCGTAIKAFLVRIPSAGLLLASPRSVAEIRMMGPN